MCLPIDSRQNFNIVTQSKLHGIYKMCSKISRMYKKIYNDTFEEYFNIKII